jgi:hypothetical protein
MISLFFLSFLRVSAEIARDGIGLRLDGIFEVFDFDCISVLQKNLSSEQDIFTSASSLADFPAF